MHTLRTLSTATGHTSSAVRRGLHSSAAHHAITKFAMPAMSPTMTEGGVASWKKKEGDSFTTGDILLEVETDKATIDVEAQDDGVLGKILAQDGTKNIPVGKIIALLAEEGDDLASIKIPDEEEPAPTPTKSESSTSAASTSSSSSPASAPSPSTPSSSSSSWPSHSGTSVHPSHSRPLFPSVLRLLQENGITDTSAIKGTGVRGMLTKGDVLVHLGKASTPTGTFKPSSNSPIPPKSGSTPQKEPAAPLDGPALRRLIVGNMLAASMKARSAAAPPPVAADFDSIISDYIPVSKFTAAVLSGSVPPPTPKPTGTANYLEGLY